MAGVRQPGGQEGRGVGGSKKNCKNYFVLPPELEAYRDAKQASSSGLLMSE